MSTHTCNCSHCGNAITFPDNMAGTNGFCPSCGQQVLLQSAVTTDIPQASSGPVASTTQAQSSQRQWKLPDSTTSSQSKEAASTTPSQSKEAEKSSDYLERIRENTCYESARKAVGFGSIVAYIAGGGIVFAGCWYGGNDGGGPAVSVIGWAIIALTKGGEPMILAILDMADIQLEVNRRK